MKVKARHVRKVVDDALTHHRGDVRRSERTVSNHYFYQATCACGFCTDALTDLAMVMRAIQNHVRDEVTIDVYRRIKKLEKKA